LSNLSFEGKFSLTYHQILFVKCHLLQDFSASIINHFLYLLFALKVETIPPHEIYRAIAKNAFFIFKRE